MVSFSDVYMGMVVEYSQHHQDIYNDSRNKYGMVVGISQNSLREPTLKVQWQDSEGESFDVHPINISKVGEI